MKTKILLLASACLLNCAIVFGQRQQTTEDYNPSPAGFPTTGKKTYSYIIGEDGKKLKDGSFSISAKPDILVVDKGFSRYAVSNNGYFKLNTTFVKGNLHGALTSSFGITVTKQGLAGNASESQSMTFSGNFSDGLPHGTFNIKYDTDSNDKLVATYNKGVLVGSYSSSGIYKKLPCIVKGTLTSKGELTGKWTIEDLKSHIYEFQNGVLIRETSEKEATKPALTELAKKYAAGAITEAELEKQNIIVLEDSIPLGSFARNIIFRDEVFDIQDVGGYDFSNPNNKRYKYLKEVSCFNEKGFEFYTQMLDEKLKAGVFTHYANIQKNQKHEYGEIGFVNGSHAIRDAYLNHCDPYINAKGLKEHDWKTDIYLTKEQVRIWGEKMTEAKKLHAQSFGIAGSEYNYSTGSYYFDSDIKMYFIETDRVFTFYEYERMRKSAKKEIENGTISKVLNRFMLVTGEPDYLIEKANYEYDALLFAGRPFVKKESIERDTTIIYLLAGEYEKLIKGKSKEEIERIDVIKKELDEKYKKAVETSLADQRVLKTDYPNLYEYLSKKETAVWTKSKYKELKASAEDFVERRGKDLAVLEFLPEYCVLTSSNGVYRRSDIEEIFVIAEKEDKIHECFGINDTLSINNIRKAYQEKNKEDALSTVIPPVKNILDRLVNQSAMSIAYADDVDDYFSSAGLPKEYWHLEFKKKLNPFGKILGYEIVDFHGEEFEEVECVLTCLGKKKAQNKYKVIWGLEKDDRGNIRIIANSIDINNATIIVDAAQHANAEAERIAKEEAERVAKEKAEAKRIAKAEAEQLAKEKAEAERLEKEQAEAARLAKVEEERAAKAEAEAKRIAKVEAERAEKEKARTRTSEEKQTIEENLSITHEEDSKKAARPAKEKKQTNYKQYVDLSLNGSYAGINYIGGYKLNQYLFLGIGTGVDKGMGSSVDYHSIDGTACGPFGHDHSYRAEIGALPISIPLYLDFRVNLSKKKWSTYLGASAGYRFSSTEVSFGSLTNSFKVNGSSPILSVALGVNKAINDKCALFLSVGVERAINYSTYELSTTCDGIDEYVYEVKALESEYWLAPTLSFGISF